MRGSNSKRRVSDANARRPSAQPSVAQWASQSTPETAIRSMHIQLGTVDASDPPDTVRYLNPLHGMSLPAKLQGPLHKLRASGVGGGVPVAAAAPAGGSLTSDALRAYEAAGAASGLPPADEVWASLRHPLKGVKLASKKRRLKTIHECFSGKEVIDWFLARYPKLARAHGQLLMQQLADRGLLLSATQKVGLPVVFEDSDACLLRLKVVNDSAGHLTLIIKEAAGLIDTKGEMYCNLDVKYKKSEVSLTTNNWKTQLCKGPVPKWNATFKAPTRVMPQNLQFELQIFGKHSVGSNTFLGQLELPLDPLTSGEVLEDWFPLQMRRQGEEVRGEVLLSLSFTSVNEVEDSSGRSSSVAALLAAAQEDEEVRDEGFVEVEDPADQLAELEYSFDLGKKGGGELMQVRNADMPGGTEYKASSLVKLVELLSSADIPAGATIVDDVLCTYPTFTNPMRLLNLFLKRYVGPPEGSEVPEQAVAYFKTNQKDIQNRVGSFLARWMTSTTDFSDNAKLFSYLRKLVDQDFFAPTPSLAKYFAKKYDESKKKRLGLDGPIGPGGVPERSLSGLGSGGTLRGKRGGTLRGMDSVSAMRQVPLLDLNTDEIAEQITLIEHDLFRAIEPIELLNQNWNKHSELSPHVLEYIQWFNKMCQWAGTEIIKEDNPESRAVIISKFIRIADRLAELNNFNGLMEILASLEGSAIRRLKLSWAQLPQADAATLERLSTLMNPQKNFKDYRAAILASAGKPWIPYLGLHLTDLTFVDDGNTTWLDNSSTLINLQKAVMTAQCVRTVLDSAKIDYYGIRPMNSIQKLLVNVSNSVFDDNEIYRLSLLREARNAGGDAADRGRGNRNRLANIAKSMMARDNVTAEKELTDADWAVVLEGARTVLFKKDQVIIQQGTLNTKMYMMQTGRVRVEKKGDAGEPIVLTTMDPPKVFGEMSIIMPDNKPAVSCVADVDDMKLYETNYEELHKAFAQHPDLARRFYMTMAKKLSEMLVALVPPKKKKKKEKEKKHSSGGAAAAMDDTEDDSSVSGGVRKKKKKKKKPEGVQGSPRGEEDRVRRRKPKRRDSESSSRRSSMRMEALAVPSAEDAAAAAASAPLTPKELPVDPVAEGSAALPPPPDPSQLPPPPDVSQLPPPTATGMMLPKHAPPPPPPVGADEPATAAATAAAAAPAPAAAADAPAVEGTTTETPTVVVKKVRKKKVVRRKRRPPTARKEENKEADALRYSKAFGLTDYVGKFDASWKRYEGKLVLFEKHVCFFSEMFMTTTKRIYPMARIQQLDQRSDGVCMCTLSTDVVLTFPRDAVESTVEAIRAVWEKVEKEDVDMDEEGVAQDTSSLAPEELFEESQKKILTESDWELMLNGAKKVTYQDGEYIIRQGDAYQRVYYMVRGQCVVEVDRGGEPVVINRMKEGISFGEMSFINVTEDSDYKASASVLASGEVEVSIIEGYFLNILFDMYGGLEVRFFEYLCAVLAKRIHKQTALLKQD